jgi:hypothetical protein
MKTVTLNRAATWLRLHWSRLKKNAARKGSEAGDDLESQGKVDVRHLGLKPTKCLLKGLIEKHAQYTNSATRP